MISILLAVGLTAHFFDVPAQVVDPYTPFLSGPISYYGNALVDRLSATDGPNVMFISYATLPPGELVSFKTYKKDATVSGKTFNAYVLRPTGVSNEYFVVSDSGILTVPASPTMGTIEYDATDVVVQSGDKIAEYGTGIPWDGSVPQGTILYPATTKPTAGETIKIGIAPYPIYGTNRAYSFGAMVQQ